MRNIIRKILIFKNGVVCSNNVPIIWLERVKLAREAPPPARTAEWFFYDFFCQLKLLVRIVPWCSVYHQIISSRFLVISHNIIIYRTDYVLKATDVIMTKNDQLLLPTRQHQYMADLTGRFKNYLFVIYYQPVQIIMRKRSSPVK